MIMSLYNNKIDSQRSNTPISNAPSQDATMLKAFYLLLNGPIRRLPADGFCPVLFGFILDGKGLHGRFAHHDVDRFSYGVEYQIAIGVGLGELIEKFAARIRVIIESRDKTGMWGTVGVSENIIEASWMALTDSIEYKLAKDKEPVAKPEPTASA